MHPVTTALLIIFSLIIVFFSVCYLCFRLTFYVPNRKKIHPEDEMPPGKIYLPYHQKLREWQKQAKTFKQEQVSITSFDGLTLKGKYYEFFKGAPIEIMFHGYRGSAERDLCGGLQRCIGLKRNALIVDQRGNGQSDGNIITFGIKERYDVKAWTEYAFNRFGDSVKLIITGISMGASTVIMASSMQLPKTVVGVVADCGYDSIEDIIKTVIKKLRLPAWLFYPIIKLGARIFGGFNLEQTSPIKEVANSKLPIIFLHGDSDDFVPCYMSKNNFNACKTKKGLEIFSGAGHGMAFLVDPNRYISVLKEFEKNHL